ncbi:hypothetical protein ACFLYQ_04650 [Chloroflexota bacterium]
MFWIKNTIKVCNYWDCVNDAQGEALLCADHQAQRMEGLLDKCPKCGRFKDVIYQFCLDCYVGRKVKKKKPVINTRRTKKAYKVELTSASSNDYYEPEKLFVYVIEVGEGILYVGYTDDIHNRLSEVRKRKKSPETGWAPKLRYMESAKSKKSAETAELKLKELIIRDPKQIDVLSANFYKGLKEYGFDYSL